MKSISLDKYDNIYIGGSTSHNGNIYGFLAKLDADGNLIDPDFDGDGINDATDIDDDGDGVVDVDDPAPYDSQVF